MIVKLESDHHGKDCFIPIPDKVLEQVGWEPGDRLVIDFPTMYPDQIIVYKEKKKK